MERIGELEVDNVKMAEERDRLKNDPEYFEQVARQQMGLIREGEVVYRVVPKGTKQAEALADHKRAQKPDPAKVVAKKKLIKKSKQRRRHPRRKPRSRM